jgi:hypothetical protein
MKTVFIGLVLIVGTLSANASDIGNKREQEHGSANAPVCPPGQVAKVVGVVDGKVVWECVPVGT